MYFLSIAGKVEVSEVTSLVILLAFSSSGLVKYLPMYLPNFSICSFVIPRVVAGKEEKRTASNFTFGSLVKT